MSLFGAILLGFLCILPFLVISLILVCEILSMDEDDCSNKKRRK